MQTGQGISATSQLSTGRWAATQRYQSISALRYKQFMMPATLSHACREQKRSSEALKEEVQALQLAILKQVLESPGCVPLSELLLADLSNPTPATLHHLQQLASLATQKQGTAHQDHLPHCTSLISCFISLQGTLLSVRPSFYTCNDLHLPTHEAAHTLT
jgi:hypothetical protein